MSRILTWFHTVRHLRPVQIYGRFWFKWHQPRVNPAPAPPLRSPTTTWVQQPYKQPALLRPWLFRFLNAEHTLDTPDDWDDPAIDKLWRYNLHYFDDLNACDAEQRTAWHRELIDRWIRENPPAKGSGWEPYTTSLRIINWIKWSLSGHELSSANLDSLAMQTRWLLGRLERHILANHFFINAKALLFAGLFFTGDEARQWREQGLRILQREMPEQILPDGGQFERSPMYHALALEDMLDLLNLMRVYDQEIPDPWLQTTQAMRHWLQTMSHPDGEIALFNDAAFGIGPTSAHMERYALRLGFEPNPPPPAGITHLADSGYIRLHQGQAVIILDAGPIGPDYQPGHAHADTLSFEMSLFDQRLLVDSGVSCYHCPHERPQQRATAAHNTIEIDGLSSSEVWSTFRVARRAKITDLATKTLSDGLFVQASHDGYRRIKGVGLHERTWMLAADHLTITDQIDGHGIHELRIAFHIHPDFLTDQPGLHHCVLHDPHHKTSVQITLDEQLNLEIAKSGYHREFGRTTPNQVLIGRWQGPLPVKLSTRVHWQRSH